MNIEELEKLNELKEKGIISQEVFNQKKKEILKDVESRFSFKNLLLSFAVMCLYCLVLGIAYACVSDNAEIVRMTLVSLNIFLGLLFYVFGKYMGTNKYTYFSSDAMIFWDVFLTGPLGVWYVAYGFLQIKSGHVKQK